MSKIKNILSTISLLAIGIFTCTSLTAWTGNSNYSTSTNTTPSYGTNLNNGYSNNPNYMNDSQGSQNMRPTQYRGYNPNHNNNAYRAQNNGYNFEEQGEGQYRGYREDVRMKKENSPNSYPNELQEINRNGTNKPHGNY
jgi:hypothetical protein